MGRAQRSSTAKLVNPSFQCMPMGFAALYPSYALPILRIRCPGSRMFDFTPAELTAIALSLKVATVAALASLPFGIATVWLLARKRFFGKALVDALVHLTLVLPPVVVGYVLLVAMGNNGVTGGFLMVQFDLGVAFRWNGAALASAVMGFPLMVRTIRLSIESADRRLEQAAATLGATPWRVFRSVTLPLAWPGIVAGTVLAVAARKRGGYGKRGSCR